MQLTRDTAKSEPGTQDRRATLHILNSFIGIFVQLGPSALDLRGEILCRRGGVCVYLGVGCKCRTNAGANAEIEARSA